MITESHELVPVQYTVHGAFSLHVIKWGGLLPIDPSHALSKLQSTVHGCVPNVAASPHEQSFPDVHVITSGCVVGECDGDPDGALDRVAVNSNIVADSKLTIWKLFAWVHGLLLSQRRVSTG